MKRTLYPFAFVYLTIYYLLLSFPTPAPGQPDLPVDSVAIRLLADPGYLRLKETANCDPAYQQEQGTTASARLCTTISFEQTWNQLQVTLAEVAALLQQSPREGRLDLLLDTQRRWISMRNDYCQVYYRTYRGGSLAPLVYISCLGKLTQHREEELLDLKTFLE